MDGILKLENITKRFGGLTAVNSVSCTVNQGEIVGIIGPNGAGKTTVFNLIVGLHKPTSGKIFFKGNEIQGLPSHKIAQLGIAKTFQTISLFDDMTILENVVVGSLLRQHKVSNAIDYAEKILEIVDFRYDTNCSPGDLSLVDRCRLEVARAYATDPQILLLDEVMAGLTHSEGTEAINMIKKLRENGMTIIVVEHNMRAIMSLSDKIIARDHGMKIAEGSPAEVSTHPEVIMSYLGVDQNVES